MMKSTTWARDFLAVCWAAAELVLTQKGSLYMKNSMNLKHFSMMNFNYFNQGYADGIKDALLNKKMDFTKFPKGLKSLASKQPIETYVDGYKQGYSAGMAKKHGVFK